MKVAECVLLDNPLTQHWILRKIF